MSKLGSLGARLYRGEVSYDFVGRHKRWYAISGVVIIVAAIALFTRGLQFSIDFKGGDQFTVPVTSTAPFTTDDALRIVGDQGIKGATAQQETTIGHTSVLVQTPSLSSTQRDTVQNSLASAAHTPSTNSIEVQSISGSWGSQITSQAVKGLIIFLILVVIYLAIFFEWRMPVAAIVALAHDLIITVGIYALVGFEVSPATVTGVLTILGYSLYDTVVVFDKVRENSKSLTTEGKYTYSEAANRAVNQTLVRSINTSLIALLPVLALLFAGFELNGAGVMQDLALALFVGIAAGTYSSIFIATPLLAAIKEREPTMVSYATSLRNKRAKAAQRAAAATGAATTAGAVDDEADDGPTEPAHDGGDVIAAGANAGAGTDSGRRTPRSQPVRDKPRNRPSGKKRR
jgi:preprotein translocase subunit SecF